ncbi:MAG TPA: hypothetical protein DHU33_03945, partial [Firmicutes bacterium]|nr:hypothetical protein [Bacillota bacterium]
MQLRGTLLGCFDGKWIIDGSNASRYQSISFQIYRRTDATAVSNPVDAEVTGPANAPNKGRR